MRLRLVIGTITAICFCGATLTAQKPSIDLTPFGYKKVMSGRHAEPAFAALSYVGNNALFVTFSIDSNLGSVNSFSYTGLVVNTDGIKLGESKLTGFVTDVTQSAISIQPTNHVLVRVGNDLRIYNLDLASYHSISLPERSQIRVPTNRKSVVAVSQDGNKAMTTVIPLDGTPPISEHLDFDERAVRDGLLAISNEGSVAHAVRDPGAELAVHSGSVKWPSFSVGKYQEPWVFTNSHQLLVSAMATTPFPPTNLYLWNSDGSTRKIRGSKTGIFSSAQPSLDGTRVLLQQTDINDFLALIRGGDCGDCGNSYFYSVVDIPSAKVLLKRRRNWNCSEALSPGGDEFAELCDGIIRFYPIKN